MRRLMNEAGLWLIGIPVFLWTVLPLYHMMLFALSTKDSAFSGKLWPQPATLRNFEIVLSEQHHYLGNFWAQLGSSVLIAAATGVLTLAVATAAAFLAVPMYKTMGLYGLLNNRWAMIIAMVTLASPYAIWVLKQASDKLPVELDEAAIMDGATAMQLFRLVYLPLMVPSLVAIGVYAVLLAWNEYLYAFLLLSDEREITLAVALGLFLSADDSPWELLMATGVLYALPPAAIYYAFKRYMVSGLTAGAVKS